MCAWVLSSIPKTAPRPRHHFLHPCLCRGGLSLWCCSFTRATSHPPSLSPRWLLVTHPCPAELARPVLLPHSAITFPLPNFLPLKSLLWTLTICHRGCLRAGSWLHPPQFPVPGSEWTSVKVTLSKSFPLSFWPQSLCVRNGNNNRPSAHLIWAV